MKMIQKVKPTQMKQFPVPSALRQNDMILLNKIHELVDAVNVLVSAIEEAGKKSKKFAERGVEKGKSESENKSIEKKPSVEA